MHHIYLYLRVPVSFTGRYAFRSFGLSRPPKLETAGGPFVCVCFFLKSAVQSVTLFFSSRVTSRPNASGGETSYRYDGMPSECLRSVRRFAGGGRALTVMHSP